MTWLSGFLVGFITADDLHRLRPSAALPHGAAVMFGLTPRLHQLATFIKTYVAEHGGISPTHDEMMVAMGLHSKSGISRMVDELEARGVIARKKHASRSVIIRDEDKIRLRRLLCRAIEAYCAHTRTETARPNHGGGRRLLQRTSDSGREDDMSRAAPARTQLFDLPPAPPAYPDGVPVEVCDLFERLALHVRDAGFRCYSATRLGTGFAGTNKSSAATASSWSTTIGAALARWFLARHPESARLLRDARR